MRLDIMPINQMILKKYNKVLIQIKLLITNYRDKNFKDFDPIEVTQLIRGRIFTFIDIFMTNNYDSKNVNITLCINQIVDLLYEFLDFKIDIK